MLKPLTKEAIGQEFTDDLSVQDYGKKVAIEGVKIIPLNLFVDDGGALAEIARLDDNGNLQILPEFKVKQSTFRNCCPVLSRLFICTTIRKTSGLSCLMIAFWLDYSIVAKIRPLIKKQCVLFWAPGALKPSIFRVALPMDWPMSGLSQLI